MTHAGEPRVRVWAPHASSVEVETNGERQALSRSADGWWVLRGHTLDPGADYGFVLDGQPPLPDPRSAHQPYGVHGPSRLVEHAEFPWTDQAWHPPPLSTAVIYELHVGTFTPAGTFEGVIAKLDTLRDLGVTHVELMPVNAFPGERGWGYDGVALYAVQEAYGGPTGLKRLVDACHARGLAILLDVVYNHLGPDGNTLERFAPYFTDSYSTFWGPALNLDQAHSDQVRRFICDNARSWLVDYHIDGLRLDAVHAFFDRSAKHLLEQLAEEVSRVELETGRQRVLIAESDLGDPRLVRSREAGGYGLDAQWSDDLHHALHTVITGEKSGYYADFGTMGQLARALEDAFVYQGEYSPARQRRHGRSPTGIPRHRFLGYLQTHDQVGNRARGERISHLTTPARVRVGAALYLTCPSVPMLFMGEEWGASTPFCYFVDHQTEELREAVRKGRIAEFVAFGWSPEEIPDPQAESTFQRSKLDWEERIQDAHRTMLAWYETLLRLRREHPDLRRPVDRIRFDEATRWLIVERARTWVLANLGTEALVVEAPGAPLLLAACGDAGLQGNQVSLPPDSAAILLLDG